MAELLNCPFCGHSAALESVGADHFVMCDGCCAESARCQSPTGDADSAKRRAAEYWNRRATDGQRAGVPEVWKLVPVEPTHDMLVALSGEWHSSRNAPYRAKYTAMLAAAPKPDIGMTISAVPEGHVLVGPGTITLGEGEFDPGVTRTATELAWALATPPAGEDDRLFVRLCEIRAAAGDNGEREHDELVRYIGELLKDAELWRAKENGDAVKCKACGGNDGDVPCAYPEGHPRCLRKAGDAGQERSANPYGEGYEDGLAHAAFYVRDHCAEGEYHADVIEKLRRPARAAIEASKGEKG